MRADHRTRATRRVRGSAWLGAFCASPCSVGLSSAPASAKTTTTTVATPKKWDPRLAPIADQVAELRGLKFDHPVAAEFLDDAAFEKQVTVDKGKLSKARQGRHRAIAGPASSRRADRCRRRPARRHQLAPDLGRARLLQPEDEEDHGEGHEHRRRLDARHAWRTSSRTRCRTSTSISASWRRTRPKAHAVDAAAHADRRRRGTHPERRTCRRSPPLGSGRVRRAAREQGRRQAADRDRRQGCARIAHRVLRGALRSRAHDARRADRRRRTSPASTRCSSIRRPPTPRSSRRRRCSSTACSTRSPRRSSPRASGAPGRAGRVRRVRALPGARVAAGAGARARRRRRVGRRLDGDVHARRHDVPPQHVPGQDRGRPRHHRRRARRSGRRRCRRAPRSSTAPASG